MALDLAVASDFGKPRRRSPETCFLLGLTKDGVWLISETTGRKVGHFRTLKAAIRYAREESPNGNFVIVYQPAGVVPQHLLGRAA
jgi:hypothetical protein